MDDLARIDQERRTLLEAAEQRARVPASVEVVTLVRAADQMLLSLILEDLEHVAGGLTPVADGSGFLALVLPPQHTAESIPGASVPLGPSPNRAAGPSQLRFEIAPGTVITFTVEGLLTWTDRTLVLDPRGAVSGGPYPITPPTTTFIEMPQALYLSPGADGRFVTLPQPRTFGAVTEVWRLRLGSERVVADVPNVLEPPAAEVTVRAIWTDDHEPTVDADEWTTTPTDEFTRLPTRKDQRFLVRAMGDHDMDDKYPDHEAATVQRLWLSLLGGWLDVSGSFAGTGDVAAWAQRIATGRDSHVRVTRRGWLAPFGHAAAVIEIAERKFLVDTANVVTAALQKQEFLSVTPSTIDYTALVDVMPHEGREVPFHRLDMTSNLTVEITRSPILDVDTALAFVPNGIDDGEPVTFDYTATDRTGAHTVAFTMPGAFVHVDVADDEVTVNEVISFFEDAASIEVRETTLGGQPVAYADEPQGTEGEGKTTLSTQRMSFTLRAPAGTVSGGLAPFIPAMDSADVFDARVDALRGLDADPFTVVLNDHWLTDGLDTAGNLALAFLDLDTSITLPFSGGGSGLSAPDLNVEQLTALLGPAIRLAAGGEWDPATALAEAALFLGTVKLKDVIAAINIGGDALPAEGLPRFDVELRRPDPAALPDALCISLRWTAPLKRLGDTLLVPADFDDDSPFDAGAKGELAFLVEQCLPLDDPLGEPELTVDVAVRNFMIQLPPPKPIIGVAFSRIRFLDPPDGPPDVDVDIAAVRFLGSLTFLDPIQEFLSGLGGGPRLEISDDAVQADLTFPLPDISLGVLGITGLEVGTGLVVDLTGGPLRSAFNLGTRGDPFTLSVLGFGGSGSLELEASPHPLGIVRLELSFAFVIELTVDVVVAKGSLRASFGAALEVEAITTDEDEASVEVTLTAFLDVVGEVEVLGLISIMIQVLLTLEYNASTEIMSGTATVNASVDVGFIEKEVSFSVSHEMALGDSAAAFRTALAAGAATTAATDGFAARFPDKDIWSTYCAAFAP